MIPEVSPPPPLSTLEARLQASPAQYELLSKLLVSPLIMENQMEKKMENEMETAIYRVM